MCTVTFLPLSDNNFILTSNRDEAKARPASEVPQVWDTDNVKMLYPKDGLAGGSWIGVSEKKRAVCLLNGAFMRHDRINDYRKSRGIIVMESLSAENSIDFLRDCDLNSIEPFTLIIIDWKNSLRVWEIRWDGFQKHTKALLTKPMIWSSPMLYTDQMQRDRERWFSEWLKSHSDYDIQSIREFHNSAGEGDPVSNLRTERGFLSTISITSIEKTSFATNMIYKDLVTEENSVSSFDLMLIGPNHTDNTAA